MMRKIAACFFCFYWATAIAQVEDKSYPKHAFGFQFEAGFAQVQQSSLTSGADGGTSFTALGLLELNASTGLGLETGLGFDYRRYSLPSSRYYDDKYQQVFALQIPAIIQLRPAQFLTIEAGVETDFIFMNKRDVEVNNITTNTVELIGLGGLRFRLNKGMSIGFALRWGLTPFEEKMGYTTKPIDKAYHRGIVISVRYLFY